MSNTFRDTTIVSENSDPEKMLYDKTANPYSSQIKDAKHKKQRADDKMAIKAALTHNELEQVVLPLPKRNINNL